MEYTFNYEITLCVKFTDEEWDLLDQAINESEYKHEAQVGGWWYGNKNRRFIFGAEEEKFENEGYYTFRQLDTLSKCLEPFINYLNDDFARGIYYSISRMLGKVNTEHEALSLIKDNQFRKP